MRYFEIMFDDENSKENEMVCYADDNFEEKYKVNQYDINEGKFITNWDNKFTFYYDCNEGTVTNDYLANNLGWFLISPKFKDILLKQNVKNVQYLPVIIKEKNNGCIIESFHVVNITTLTDALDLDNSKYTERTIDNIKFKSIIKCALKSKYIEGLDLLRIKDNKFSTYISERIKKEINRNKLTGMDLLEVKVI
jgi:hypothetical protein